ncbi:hypothetical protein POSPLADRAFT_1129366 [Postia placenta MAD-698-R-SB12]|uniref:DNA mismatch repair proteins mutS family domain-containing protein n=1 Tax=Postia placenta MAD-698-R-SB12 TaxID=670580 RepID=A0A1X6NGF7_9APHY|nr:hypothetical protein POSPLADRAFT_1129366 [Postia placenta MAD-698-R-SB12]OSX67715.1 hypothetical protein POSPLADRAFT_1129366 [Postia placenta MAD-698-R-SB12]
MEPSPLQPKNRLASGILDNLARFPHCILLTRVGQFYESYFDQAQEVAHLLNIKLTQRTWNGQRVWMCGFPLMHLDKYLKILVQNHKRFVALCEEFPRSPHLGPKGGFDRRVVRIVTPGTLIDEPFLNPYENNYLLAIVDPESPAQQGPESATDRLGLAWTDVSTGELFTKTIPIGSLRDELARISPREVVLDEGSNKDRSHPVYQATMEEDCFVSFYSPSTDAIQYTPTLVSSIDTGTDDVTAPSEQSGIALSNLENDAITLLTAFMQANLLEHMPRLSLPSRESTKGRMQIDAHTIKALEIREGYSDGGSTGSLISAIKRTVTSSGTRLLVRWLCSPSTSLEEINARQSLVAFFYARPHLRDDLLQSLRELDDASRIVQKFLLGRGQPSDLAAISSTIRIWESIKKQIEFEKIMEKTHRELKPQEWESVEALLHGMYHLESLSERIEGAINAANIRELSTPSDPIPDNDEASDSDSDPKTLLSTSAPVINTNNAFGGYKWQIRRGFSADLDELHNTFEKILERKQLLEQQLQSTYNAPSLSLRSSPGQGMHVHVAKGKRDSSRLTASSHFIPLSTSSSTNTFFYQEWSQLGAQFIETITAIQRAEKAAFEALRDEASARYIPFVIAHSGQLRRNARILDELDVTISYANLAVDMNLVRPHLTDSSIYRVVNGRHPTVELGLLRAGRGFTPNTVTLTPTSSLHVITGPNMAGKSTLLRQTALISVLAQSGSFVPADSAELGVVDRVFSRIGARDDLFRDRSTFMVEMLETNEILRRATPRSLVIMDEVGRGTTVDDGLAIAFAAVHHLVTVNKCRALFATHFHELADMLGCTGHQGQGPFSGVSFFCTDVDETEDGYFAYSHRLQPGVNRNSHGLKVAQLSGMPESAMAVANTALSWLKKRRTSQDSAQVLRALGQSLASPKSIASTS